MRSRVVFPTPLSPTSAIRSGPRRCSVTCGPCSSTTSSSRATRRRGGTPDSGSSSRISASSPTASRAPASRSRASSRRASCRSRCLPAVTSARRFRPPTRILGMPPPAALVRPARALRASLVSVSTRSRSSRRSSPAAAWTARVGGGLLHGHGRLVGAEVATVGAERPRPQLGDGVDVVEQLPVVADHHQRALPTGDDVEQSSPGAPIEVVGRLIEEEHVRLGQQPTGEAQQDALASGETRHRPVEGHVAESELIEQRPRCAPRRPSHRRSRRSVRVDRSPASMASRARGCGRMPSSSSTRGVPGEREVLWQVAERALDPNAASRWSSARRR